MQTIMHKGVVVFICTQVEKNLFFFDILQAYLNFVNILLFLNDLKTKSKSLITPCSEH